MLGGLCSELQRGNGPIRKQTWLKVSLVSEQHRIRRPQTSETRRTSPRNLFTGVISHLGQSVLATTDVDEKKVNIFFPGM